MSIRFCVTCLACVVCVNFWTIRTLHAESFRCPKEIDIFDPGMPSKKMGSLSKGTDIELSSTIDANGMISLVYTTSDGDLKSGVIRAQDIGKQEATTAAPKQNVQVASKKSSSSEAVSSRNEGNIQSMVGNLLINERGESVPSTQLGKSRYILVYYSAHWCPPCRAFSPKLVSFYKQYQDRGIEVVFVSSDKSEEDQLNYMKEVGMTFPAVKFDSIQSSKIKKFCGRGIPCLVAFDQNGNIVSDTNVNGQYLGPQKVLKDVENLITN